jgi:glucose-1-phosphate adenylyltransferase
MQIEKGVTVKNAMIMGNDFYESEEERDALAARGGIPVGVGENSYIENAILDKNARVGKNVHISNKDGVDEWEPAETDPEQYMIRSGIVVVMKNGTIPDGTVI